MCSFGDSFRCFAVYDINNIKIVWLAAQYFTWLMVSCERKRWLEKLQSRDDGFISGAWRLGQWYHIDID